MSKYIRTENGVYELKENSLSQTPIEIQNALITKNYKIADTIPELCDEFIVDDVINNIRYLEDYDDIIEDIYYGSLHPTTIIYGAIYTNKGLIYIAKMNNKGELELI